jgi:tetratricopeptide (TPR) repeat protein
MVGTLTPGEEAQLAQTVEMFEVITQSQPQDYQSLEILKEAYVKLGRDEDALKTSKRIAQAYVLMGQLSSAILEYESILQRFPEDPDVLKALEEIESRANSLNNEAALGEASATTKGPMQAMPKPKAKAGPRLAPTDLDDGHDGMHKIFVEGKVISAAQFDECWRRQDFTTPPEQPVEPFLGMVVDKKYVTLEKALRLISDKSRHGYLPLERYDVDVEVTRSFPAETCRRWCVLPFDRLSKSVCVATANPFNRQAVAELEEVTRQRLLWYLAAPAELVRVLKKVFR